MQIIDPPKEGNVQVLRPDQHGHKRNLPVREGPLDQMHLSIKVAVLYRTWCWPQ